MTETPVFRELDPVRDAALIEKLAQSIQEASRRTLQKALREGK